MRSRRPTQMIFLVCVSVRRSFIDAALPRELNRILAVFGAGGYPHTFPGGAMYGLLPVSIRHRNSYQGVLKIRLPCGRQRQHSTRNSRLPAAPGVGCGLNGATVSPSSATIVHLGFFDGRRAGGLPPFKMRSVGAEHGRTSSNGLTGSSRWMVRPGTFVAT
jgi:hypothetical protein